MQAQRIDLGPAPAPYPGVPPYPNDPRPLDPPPKLPLVRRGSAPAAGLGPFGSRDMIRTPRRRPTSAQPGVSPGLLGAILQAWQRRQPAEQARLAAEDAYTARLRTARDDPSAS